MEGECGPQSCRMEQTLDSLLSVPTDECVEWPGYKNPQGYGWSWYDRKKIAVHRFVQTTRNGPIPEGYFVCHRCDNPSCVNPKHLYAGTPADNSRDAVERGLTAKGEQQGSHRFTEEDVLEIVRLSEEGGLTLRQIADRFQCSLCAVNSIDAGQSWGWLTGIKREGLEKNRRTRLMWKKLLSLIACPTDECIEYTDATALQTGTGRVKTIRWIYQDRCGEIPSGVKVGRNCGNAKCVNPKHLRLLVAASAG